MNNPLIGKTAIITGASAGIGWAVAEDLAAAGAKVVVSARRKERLEALVKKIVAGGGSALAVEADAGDTGQIDQLVKETQDWAGRLDIVVVNAGRGLAGGILSSDQQQWESMYRLNVLGAAYLMRRAGEILCQQGRGDIVVLGSVSGHHISPFSGFYGSSKWAIAGAAEAMRREVCGKGVRVSIIKPGIVASEFQAAAGYDAESFGAWVKRWGQPLNPADVAKVITFIVSQPGHVHINEIVLRPTRQDYP